MPVKRGLAGLALLLLCLPLALAQSSNPPPEGIDSGNYNYQGSFEFGYRFVDTAGNSSVYNTFVNQQQGPRLLEQTLSLRSRNHAGSFFDTLFWSSFGWGGDPENASRLRLSKNQWYNFNATFRRDQNFWDYNLLASPLNPPNSFVAGARTPHPFETRRRWYDYNLTLLPQSKVRVRLGYSRNVHEGPSFSSFHEGTDTLLFQPWRNTFDGYQMGVDVRLLPRTNISYDQFLQYYKGDTAWADQNLNFQLSNGTPVDAGLIYNPAANQPCSNAPTPVFNTSTTPPTLRAACNGYLGYSRFAPVRTSYPVEQLTLQSSYFRRLNVSGRFSYSSSEAGVNGFNESFDGLATRTNLRQFATTGLSRAKRVVANLDFGVTLHLTDKLRVADSFRFSNSRIPGGWNLLTASSFGANLLSTPNQFDPATCPPPFTAATCPQHTSSSPADVVNDQLHTFLKQEQKLNTIELEYELARRLSGHLGYRYERRSIVHGFSDVADLTVFPTLANRGSCAGQPLVNGVCTVTTSDSEDNRIEVNGHSFLAGISARPVDALRLSFDTELLSADDTPTRITPRHLQRYKARGTFQPRPWFSLAGTVNLLESRNNVADVFHREHNRNYGFNLILTPRDRLSWEFGYNYNDVFSTTNICYVFGSTPPAGSTLCGAAPFIAGVSTYDNRVHFGSTSIMFKPVKRVTTNLGYNLMSTGGSTLILNPNQGTLGPLAINYHKPFAAVGIDLAKGWRFNTTWGYYGYNEKSSPGPVAARDFHSNQATLSLRYSF